MDSREKSVLRDLAKRYMEVATDPVQEERRSLWRCHNSLKPTRPLIYLRRFAFFELPESRCECEDVLFRPFEYHLRRVLFWAELGDDSIFEPWLTLPATARCTGWGVSGDVHRSGESRGSYKIDYPIKTLEDIDQLRMPWHEIDEEATARRLERLRNVLGDIITIDVDRSPAYRGFDGDLSTQLGRLRGIENFMLDMMDNPEWLRRLCAFMRDGLLQTHAQAEANGDWGPTASQNQAMPYADETRDPAANTSGVRRAEIWGYMAAQEFTLVSPAMHEEFLLEYQLPVLKEFGLVAYGCCEDLTRKIDMLRRIPNLRRIAVAPAADAARCAEQIGKDYVLSYRPSPSDMVGYGFSPERMRSIMRRDLEACRECHVDITLKDVETIEGDAERVRQWLRITRELIDELWR